MIPARRRSQTDVQADQYWRDRILQEERRKLDWTYLHANKTTKGINATSVLPRYNPSSRAGYSMTSETKEAYEAAAQHPEFYETITSTTGSQMTSRISSAASRAGQPGQHGGGQDATDDSTAHLSFDGGIKLSFYKRIVPNQARERQRAYTFAGVTRPHYFSSSQEGDMDTTMRSHRVAFDTTTHRDSFEVERQYLTSRGRQRPRSATSVGSAAFSACESVTAQTNSSVIDDGSLSARLSPTMTRRIKVRQEVTVSPQAKERRHDLDDFYRARTQQSSRNVPYHLQYVPQPEASEGLPSATGGFRGRTFQQQTFWSRNGKRY